MKNPQKKVKKGNKVDPYSLFNKKTEVKKEVGPNAVDVVNKILNRPIVWTEYRKLPEGDRKSWGQFAMELLRNPVFISICGRIVDGEKTNGELVKTLIESGMRYCEDFQGMKDIRMTINGIELVRELVEDSLYQETKETFDNLNETL